MNARLVGSRLFLVAALALSACARAPLRVKDLDGPGTRPLESKKVKTERLTMHVWTTGNPQAEPVLFVHGNYASGGYFRGVLQALPAQYYGVAVDLRGFGDTEPKKVDATRGVRDFSDDVHALVKALGLEGKPLHLVAWSMGGVVAMQYVVDHPGQVKTLTLAAPVSPYGFGGSKDEEGNPTHEDWAGAGGGMQVKQFAERVKRNDLSDDSVYSPRVNLNAFMFWPPFKVAKDHEDYLVQEMNKTRISDDHNPGDSVKSSHWPFFAPGNRGTLNAFSGKHLKGLAEAFVALTPKPKVAWVHGEKDMIVSDTSAWDFASVGMLNLMPGYPGKEVFPHQPMVKQTRRVLERYREAGGEYAELIFPGVGHSPFLEAREAFVKAVVENASGVLPMTGSAVAPPTPPTPPVPPADAAPPAEGQEPPAPPTPPAAPLSGPAVPSAMQ
jgi:pimeloyl-ACP methyl ester carboxylesterase